MARTKADARNYFLKLIDESTKKGVDLPVSKNSDYRDKFNYFLDPAQKYIAGIIKIPEVYRVTQNPIPNLIGNFSGFDLIQVLPGTPKVFNLTGCKAMYFEMDNVGTATLSINGVVAETISNTIKKQFTSYSRLTGASSSDIVTVEFSGNYPFNIRNTGFYAYAFPLEADIPVYTPYVEYDLPVDFLEFDAVIIKTDPRVYETYVAHKWENNKKIIFNYYDTGSFDIHYYKYPADILPTADDSTVLEIEEKAFELVAMQCGIMATAADNPALSSWIRSLFIEKASNISQIELPLLNSVQTVFYQ